MELCSNPARCSSTSLSRSPSGSVPISTRACSVALAGVSMNDHVSPSTVSSSQDAKLQEAGPLPRVPSEPFVPMPPYPVYSADKVWSQRSARSLSDVMDGPKLGRQNELHTGLSGPRRLLTSQLPHGRAGLCAFLQQAILPCAQTEHGSGFIALQRLGSTVLYVCFARL